MFHWSNQNKAAAPSLIQTWVVFRTRLRSIRCFVFSGFFHALQLAATLREPVPSAPILSGAARLEWDGPKRGLCTVATRKLGALIPDSCSLCCARPPRKTGALASRFPAPPGRCAPQSQAHQNNTRTIRVCCFAFCARAATKQANNTHVPNWAARRATEFAPSSRTSCIHSGRLQVATFDTNNHSCRTRRRRRTKQLD